MIDIGGQKICYHISSKGKNNLLYIHGLLDASFGFRRVIPHLSPNWKLYLVDVPSFGKSKLPPIKFLFQINLFAEMIYESILKLELQEVTLVGHSMGGLISQHIALLDKKSKTPKIKKIVLLSTGNAPHDRRDHVKELLFPANRKDVSRLLKSLYYKEIPEPSYFVKNTLLVGWNSPAYHYLAENTIAKESEIFFAEKAKEISIPTLIVTGEMDEITTLDSMKQLHGWISNSKLVIIPNAKHAIHLETPERVSQEINQFGLENENNQ
jgi:pimeloyl-ACP methyl ester carboxylesterase